MNSLIRSPLLKNSLQKTREEARELLQSADAYLQAMEEGLTNGSQELNKTGGPARKTVAKFFQGYADFLGMIRGSWQPEPQLTFEKPLEGRKKALESET